MLHPSTKRLIDKLDGMTRKQRVGWEESDNGSIKHDTEGYRVTLTAAPHSLLLTDTLGREIETCTPEDFAGETDANGQPYTDFIEALYREAHRHARGAEKAISALLSSLDEADTEDGGDAEAAGPLSGPESFEHPEDEGDESHPLEDHELPEPEYEGQADMQAAIAAMADEMSEAPPAAAQVEENHEPAPAPEPEPAPEVITETEPYAPFAGSSDTARPYAVAAEFAAPTAADPAPLADEPASETAEADSAAEEPFSEENSVWETIRNASGEAEAPAADPGPASETPAPAEAEDAPASRPSPVFGSALFNNNLNDLSQSREPDAEATPEAAPEATSEPAPAPEPEPEPEQPAPRSFSLSGITSGFGLGSTHSAHRVQPDTPSEAAEPAQRGLIDGTVDLPDTLPDALPEDAPAPTDEWRMEQDEEFGFTEDDLMPGVPAKPLPAVTDAAPETPEPEAPAEKPEPETNRDSGSEHPTRPARRFNPWN